MLKFIYIKIGVNDMKKHIFAMSYVVTFLFMAGSLFAATLPENMELTTKLDLFATHADTSNNFIDKYNESYLKLDINFAYKINDNLSVNFLPYARTSYDVKREDKTETKAKIWQAYLNYKISNFGFNLGRFDFADNSLAPFIYYGDNLPKDLALPTALDGIKHNFTSKYLSYTLLLAEEAQIDENTKAKLAGAKVTAKPLAWLNLSGFYFYQNKKYPYNTTDKINSKLSVYGAGLDLFLSETSGLRFYGAKNGGEKQRIRPVITQTTPYKGYAFNGELYFKNFYEKGTLDTKLGFYVFSDKEKFQPFPNKLETGIICGGLNHNNVFMDSSQVIYAVLDFNFKKYPFLYAGLGVYVYSYGKGELDNQNYYAQELNLNAGLKFNAWGIKLSGGFFDGEALFEDNTTSGKQKIKKIQANFFYKFTL